MRIAFLIRRKNYYRLLGPVVEEALRRGYQAECWHDWSHSKTGGKSSEFPDTAPSFRAGTPIVRAYHRPSDLAEHFREDSPDAVVCLDPPDPDVKAVSKAKWVWLQYSADIVLYPTPQGILDADAVATYSPYWVTKLEERFRETGLVGEVRPKMLPTGVPELDAVSAIDRDEVRRRLGLPSHRPVVLYLPFPLRSNPQTFWLRHVYAPSTRLGQGFRTLLGGRREYWPHVVNGWCDRRLVEAVREFCDRNGAALVVKARAKDPVPRYARRLADRLFYDPSHYPPTILELMSISALCVHFYSTAAYEAAFCGVPNLCLAPAAGDMGLAPFIHDFIYNGNPGGMYNWPGVAYWRPLDQAFDGLRRWDLADFPLERDARRGYIERFLGFDDGRSSGRLLDLVAKLSSSSSELSRVDDKLA